MLFTPLKRATDKVSAENINTDNGLDVLPVHSVRNSSLTGFTRKTYTIIIIAFALLLLSGGYCSAVEDGFGSSERIESENFDIYYKPQLKVSTLGQQLNVSASDKLLAGKSISDNPAPENELAVRLDTLFIQVCDILDMQLYSFKSNIKITKDHEQLNKVFRKLFKKDIKTHAFYNRSNNTIYISAEHFKREILGHEMAHAIISHYFVVSPSVKVQEILAVYVEYQLRKKDK